MSAAPALSLAIPAPEHVGALLAWRESPSARRFNPFDPVDARTLAARLARASASLAELGAARAAGSRTGPDEWRRAVLLDGRLVGVVSLRDYDARMLKAEIGYQVAPEAQGRGIGTAAVRALCAAAFAETPLRRLIALIHEDNLASRRLIERVGFRLEGILREHYLIEGRPANEAAYGLLRGEAT